jgi:hypothetical protein
MELSNNLIIQYNYLTHKDYHIDVKKILSKDDIELFLEKNKGFDPHHPFTKAIQAYRKEINKNQLIVES